MVRSGLDRCDGQLLGVRPVEVVEHQVGGGVGGVEGVDVASNGRARKYRFLDAKHLYWYVCPYVRHVKF